MAVTAAELLAELERSGVRLELEPDGRIHVIGRLTDEQRETIRQHRDDVIERLRAAEGAPLSLPATLHEDARKVAAARAAAIERRRAEVLEMMRRSPGRIVYRTHDDGHPDGVTLALGIPGKGTCELTIPRDRYDPAALIALFEASHGPAIEPEHVADSGHSLGTAEMMSE